MADSTKKKRLTHPLSTKKTACIALPTYNEAANIRPLVEELHKTFRKVRNWTFSIVVIDDGSPDGTADIVRKLKKNNPRLHLLTGSKKGLGAAYTRGFEYILKKIRPDFVFQMDADFQHNPSYIPIFLKKVEQGYDFVIGSRYVAGGDYPDLSFRRKLYSWGANFIARKIAGIYDIDDCTSGFRCISAKFLKSFNLRSLKANGYAFQMSLLHAATRKKLRIAEIPILFPNRTRGESKLGPADIREFFLNAVRLRFKKYHFTE